MGSTSGCGQRRRPGGRCGGSAPGHNFKLNLNLLMDSDGRKFKFKIQLTPRAWPAALPIEPVASPSLTCGPSFLFA